MGILYNGMGSPRMDLNTERRRGPHNAALAPEPFAAPIPEACRLSGLSRSEIYRRLASGDIRAVKSGSRTLVLLESLRAHVAGLPLATFRAPKAAEKCDSAR